MPAGGLSVQGGDPGRRLAPQPATQYLREQRVVAIPPAPDRLDQRVGVRQRPQDAAGLVVTGQLGGGFGVDLLQDGGAQQQLAHLGRLGVEHFLHQEAGQGAVLGQQVVDDELVGVGMSGHADRGQAQTGRPALGVPGEAFHRLRRQRASVPGQQQARFVDAESEIGGPDLGQLTGQSIAVHRQRRIRAR